MKMRVLLCLALLGSAMGQGNGGNRRNRNNDSSNPFDKFDSMDANYCCMSKHRPKIAKKLADYLDSADKVGDALQKQWIEDLTKRYEDFHCTFRNGWSYCCPDGGMPQVFGNALCACQVFKATDSIDDVNGRVLSPNRWKLGDSWDDSLEVKKQDCDSVDDWMAEVIKARFGHANSSDWTPPSGTCLESEKDECGCCNKNGFGWDSDEITCEYGEDTDRGDVRFCKAFDMDFRPDSGDHLVSDDQLDNCGCMQNWGWDSDENSCIAGGETTGITEIQLCHQFFRDTSWESWDDPPVVTTRPHWGLDDSDSFTNPVGPIDLTGDDSRDNIFTNRPVWTTGRPATSGPVTTNDSDDRRVTTSRPRITNRPLSTRTPINTNSSDDAFSPGTRVTSRPVFTNRPIIPNVDDSDDAVWPGRRRLLRDARRLQSNNNNSFDGALNFLRDECGCIIGRQGFHNGKCRNNAGRGDSRDTDRNNLDSRDGRGNRRDRDSIQEREGIQTYVTDYQDIMFCRAMKNRVCTSGKKDACGCCEFWGWDRVSRTCRPGGKTNKRDARRCQGLDDSTDDVWG